VSDNALCPANSSNIQISEATIDSRDKKVIALLLISTFVVVLNETIMGVAMPRLMTELNVGASAVQWLTSAFMLTMAVVIPTTGFLLQRYSTRTVFGIAMTLFSAGTLLAAIATGFSPLVCARIVQASGTAIMLPLLITTVLTLVPESLRGRVMGDISIVISVAPAIGPAISGAVLSVLSWRWMFIVVLPIAIGSLVLGILRIENVTETRKTQLDVLSVVLSALGFGGIVYGLSYVGAAPGGNRAVSTWLSLAVGALGLASFVWRQFRLQERSMPLLDLRAFKTKNFTVAAVMVTLCTMALFGTLVLLPIYMQDVLRFPPMTVGLLLLPGGLIMGLLGPPVGRIYDRVGAFALVIPGSIIVSATLWSMVMLGVNSSRWSIVVAHVSLSAGLALLFTPLFATGLSSLPKQLYSHGSALVGTIQQLAGAAGIALFVTVMTATVIAQREVGTSEIEATAAGIQTAFLCGAIISLAAIPMAFYVRKPAT
jgi:MFS transporter, DHA2 family, lincomycin resistance protein